jgi:hypothetical protein
LQPAAIEELRGAPISKDQAGRYVSGFVEMLITEAEKEAATALTK